MAKIEIDGKQLSASTGDMIIEVADRAGIHIPRFCYHKQLSIAANCRMCMVEVSDINKTVPACATPVADGMKIFTKSDKTIRSQQAVMEFLLVNHPLDCPVCDQGGECELQDLSMGYGESFSHFDETKRVVEDKNLGPLITTDMTRCIHCTRCVRFGQEIAGVQELGLINRGEDSKIRTYVNETVHSNISGNLIDICPVGALNSKPYRFQARGWELKQTPCIAPHDCLGANIFLHSRSQKILRVVAAENPDFNETWISDRDRFSYVGLDHVERLDAPLIKEHGNWRQKSWKDAIIKATDGIKSAIKKSSPSKLAGIISPNATTEEMYLFQKLLRGLGSNNIDHRLRELDFSDQDSLPLCPTSLPTNEDVEKSSRILLVGVNVLDEQPLLSVRLGKAIKNGSKVCAINPIDYQHNFKVDSTIITPPNQIINVLTSLIKNDFEDNSANSHINEMMQEEGPVLIVTGALLNQHFQAANLRWAVLELAKKYNAQLLSLTNGCNSVGAWLAGCVPHRKEAGLTQETTGLAVKEMFSNSLDAYVLYGIEPEFDCVNPSVASNALKNAKFVVVCSSFVTTKMKEYADVILPIATFAETHGSYFNVFGKCQGFNPATENFKDSKPGWKVLRALAESCNIPSCEYYSASDLRAELKKVLRDNPFDNINNREVPEVSPNTTEQINLITEWPIYSVDSLVRRSEVLQKNNDFAKPVFRMNQTLALRLKTENDDILNVKFAGNKISLPVMIDARVPDNCLYVPSGVAKTNCLNHEAQVEIL